MKLRKWHAYLGLIAFLPLFATAFTGVFLQLRSKFEWIQPKPVPVTIEEGKPLLPVEEILRRFSSGEIDSFMYRPGKSGYIIRLKNGDEVQVHPQTGVMQKSAPRVSTTLIRIHEGSWMGPFGALIIHFSAGIILLFLLVSGLFIFPWKKWKRV
jgi:uncharacterized iron-regulated membrane protein